MATINLLIQSKLNPAVIYIRLRDGRNTDLKAKTNFHINPNQWDKKNQRPLKRLLKDIDFANLDTDLKSLKNNLLKEYNKSKGNTIIDLNWLKNFINPPSKESTYSDHLVEYIDTYIQLKNNEITKATIVKCNVIKQLLKRYESISKSKVLISGINMKFKNDFETYCTKEGYAPNTTARNIRFIKTFCNHAKNNGLKVHEQLDSIKSKYHKVDHIYLSTEEINQIEEISNSKLTTALMNSRDWLLISCYCGQRVSDFLRFNKSMIRVEKNKKGEFKPLIEFTQQKTQKIMTVPLHSKIIDILNKNDGNFPYKISSQKYNDHIKSICKIAEIDDKIMGVKFNPDTKKKEKRLCEKWELVSSHIGRRSFATNNYGIIPTSFLRYITGHTTEASFLTYIGKSNKDIAMELTEYF